MNGMKSPILLALLMLVPAAVFAESVTPSIGYTGAPTDHGGKDCRTCHRSYGPAKSDKSGSRQVMVSNYTPNSQVIRIIVQHPNAVRWGFQMTIRAQNSPTASAGTL